VALKLAKPVCDQIRACVGQGTAQVGETLRPEQQLAYDQQGPALSHDVKGASRATFYVSVPDVEAALQEAERLGGTRVMGPDQAPTGLVVGHFTDPEGNLIGLAATAYPKCHDRPHGRSQAGRTDPAAAILPPGAATISLTSSLVMFGSRPSVWPLSSRTMSAMSRPPRACGYT